MMWNEIAGDVSRRFFRSCCECGDHVVGVWGYVRLKIIGDTPFIEFSNSPRSVRGDERQTNRRSREPDSGGRIPAAGKMVRQPERLGCRIWQSFRPREYITDQQWRTNMGALGSWRSTVAILVCLVSKKSLGLGRSRLSWNICCPHGEWRPHLDSLATERRPI